ncbi:hypothetical protein SAMN02745163_03452 [Clostridium cavendishii DSM 21758]|uniref:Uncharacterized protein n=1 Tax=Clostridium cavendishii DSM 21758 TaxID=1121302 RepID=A0A1M6QUF9_9CLOT|nr:hypothetical protein [Clostridium cavendishii]SHK23657.1 hypothetical protein SAMN02745163_03452 [Clostridium cavendishii DSM 21758]
MPKDSQIDNKLKRKLKSNWDTTLTNEEAKNSTRNAKKQSIKSHTGQ